jgi:hypothetical protein
VTCRAIFGPVETRKAGLYLEISSDGPVVRGNIRPTHCAIFLEWVRQYMKVPR